MKAKMTGGSHQPQPMKDRFKGGTPSLPSTGKRSFDTGTGSKGYMGATVGEGNKGSARGQKSAARFNNSDTKVTGSNTGLGGTMGMKLGRPVTAAPTYPGVAGGHGPKPGSHATGKKTIQMGKTGGTDKTPRGMRDRFKGGSHG